MQRLEDGKVTILTEDDVRMEALGKFEQELVKLAGSAAVKAPTIINPEPLLRLFRSPREVSSAIIKSHLVVYLPPSTRDAGVGSAFVLKNNYAQDVDPLGIKKKYAVDRMEKASVAVKKSAPAVNAEPKPWGKGKKDKKRRPYTVRVK
jgi:hypothetical protein